MKNGFTMIEMMVVIVILATLVGLGALGIGKAMKSAENTQRSSFIPVMKSAIAAYQTEMGGFPIPGEIPSNASELTYGSVDNNTAKSTANGVIFQEILGLSGSGERQDDKRAYIEDVSFLWVYSGGRARPIGETTITANSQVGFRIRMNATKNSEYRNLSEKFAFAPIVVTFDLELERARITIPGPGQFKNVLRLN